jgi:hypothetical protein
VERGAESQIFAAFKQAWQEGNRAWNEGDFRSAYGALPEDFELRLAGSWPNRREALRGPDEIVAFFEELREMFPDAHSGPLEFIQVDDRRAIVGFLVTGTGRSSGASTEMEIWQLWEFGQELLPKRLTEFNERDAAFEAAGAAAPAGRGE